MIQVLNPDPQNTCVAVTQALANCSTARRVQVTCNLSGFNQELSACNIIGITPISAATRVTPALVVPCGQGTARVSAIMEAFVRVEARCGSLRVIATPKIDLPVSCLVNLADCADARLLASVVDVQLITQRLTNQSGLQAIIFGQSTDEQLGLAVIAAGDLNGDGIGDWVAGGPAGPPDGLPDPGLVRVISGRDGSILYTLTGPDPGGAFGFSLAAVGDVDGDGVPDLLIGAPDTAPGGNTAAGSAFLYSGRTGTFIRRLDGVNTWDLFGWSVAGLGDVDGDGVPDFAVAAVSAQVGLLQDAGRVTVFSGSTGAPIYNIDGTESGAAFGLTMATIGDTDGDGLPDLLVGAPQAAPGGNPDAGSLFLYSGATGALLQQFDGLAPNDGFGWSVVDLGDINGDGLREIAVGAPGASPGGVPEAGSVFVYSTNGILRYRLDGQVPIGNVGTMVAFDGTHLIVGAPDAPEGDGDPTGYILIYAAATGAFLRQIQAPFAFGQFGWSGAGRAPASAAIGAPLASRDPLAAAGAVVLLSLQDAVLVLNLCVDVAVQAVRDLIVSVPATACTGLAP
ncbi:MAG TPA: integrin alpha [Symbiobacteriaceae bacterium]